MTRPPPPPTNQAVWRRLISPLHLGLHVSLAVLIFFSGQLDRLYNLWIAMLLVVGIPLAIVLLAWVGGLLKNLVQRRWWKLGGVALAPLLVWPIVIVLFRSGFDADWVRFHYNKEEYQTTLQNSGAAPLRFHSWDWGETGGVATFREFFSLVYDESDQILRKDGDTSSGGYVSVRSFGNHFYLVTKSYD